MQSNKYGSSNKSMFSSSSQWYKNRHRFYIIKLHLSLILQLIKEQQLFYYFFQFQLPRLPMKHQLSNLRLIVKALNQPTCRHIAITLLQYFDAEDIRRIVDALSQINSSHFLVKLVRNSFFLQEYINKMDKSSYFLFYEREQFVTIQKNQIAFISQLQYSSFQQYHQHLTSIKESLKHSAPSFHQNIQLLHHHITNPDFPIPHLRRQTQAIYSKSAFQIFIAHRLKHSFSTEESSFQHLKEYLSEEREEEYIKSHIHMLRNKNRDDLKKINKLRYSPFDISAHNYLENMIEGNQLHNSLVGLFALSSTFIQATQKYVALIRDPLQKFVQIMLRYNIFRNFVINIDEQLAFAFHSYDNIYFYHNNSSQKPKFNFWRPMFTKWVMIMNQHFTQAFDVYAFCLTKIRNKKVKESLTKACVNNQELFSHILTQFNSNYEYELCSKLFDDNMSCTSSIGLVFEENFQSYETLVMEYNEYLVDLSINEISVHWCGYSMHPMQSIYMDYEQKFISYNQIYLSKLFHQGNHISQNLLMDIYRDDIEYLQYLQVKNRTLRQIIEKVNSDMHVSGQAKIFINFQQIDAKLEYFNNKNHIPLHLDAQKQCYYSIIPQINSHKYFQMIETNDSNNNSEVEEYQYCSQSGDQQDKQGFLQMMDEKQTIQEQEQMFEVIEKAKKSLSIKIIFAEDDIQYNSMKQQRCFPVV